MAKKQSIQKAILRVLSNKKAVSIDSVKNDVQGAILRENGHIEDQSTKASYAIARSIKNLLNEGLVESFNSEHKQYFRLTNDGKNKLNQINILNDSSLVPTSWDGYWRIILLDLPENRKNERESLRYLLKKAGFICIKNSVWVSMYPFEHLFTNIKKDLGLSTELMIIVTDKLDEETREAFLKMLV
jgi:DNA-binding transcriptional regulator PaaX